MTLHVATLGGIFFEVFAVTATLFVVSWMAIFGVTGALLSRSRGHSAAEGLVFGAFLGPIGWALIWFQTRDSARGDLDELDPGQDGWSAL